MATSTLHDRGRRVLPVVLDQLALETPDRVYASIPRTTDLSDGFQDITVRQMAHAVNVCAHWLNDTFGSSKTFETLAYVGIHDLRYPIFWFAAIKCGYKVFFLSPRNTVAQNVSLISQTSCAHFFYTSNYSTLATVLADEFKTSQPLQVTEVNAFTHWLETPTRPYAYTKSFEEARDDPIVVLHSSGSTGDPHPITNTNDWFAVPDQPFIQIEGRKLGGTALLDYEGGGQFYSAFPAFHMAGVVAIAFFPIMMKSASVIMGHPDRPPSIEMVHIILEQKHPRVLFVPPSLIEALCQIPSALNLLKRIESVIFAGGPLAPRIGDMLCRHVNLMSFYAATEIGHIPCLLPEEPEDWEWLCWHPSWSIDMEPAVDGAFELVLNRDEEADRYNSIAATILRDQPQYRSRDLFVPHPSKPNMWQFYSRNDDIIVFSTGEKWNPVSAESMIQAQEKLSAVLILGNGKFQPAVLLEPKEEPETAEQLIEEIWPLIKQVNSKSQKVGRITRTKIAVVPPMSFMRAPKGTVIRKLTLQKHEEIINRLYSDEAIASSTDTKALRLMPLEATSAKGEFVNFVRLCVQHISALPDIDDSTDLYIHGFDSLETLELSRVLKRGLMNTFSTEQLAFLGPGTIFKNSSIHLLGEAIHDEINNVPKSNKRRRESTNEQSSRLIKQYTATIEGPLGDAKPAQGPKDLHVVLTGSTGSLGQSLLAALLACDRISKVTCMDRSAATARSKGANLNDRLISKAAFLRARFDKANFGLSDSQLRQIDDVDVFIHNAWKVDFNQSLASFEPLIAGTANIASWLGRHTKKMPRLVFVSSVIVAAGAGIADVPESLLENPSFVPPNGYGQSKLAAERILARIARISRLPTTILRVGQIAGPVMNGEGIKSDSNDATESRPWNNNEWVPALVKSSNYFRRVPKELPILVDWIPVDVLADVITEVVLDQSERSPEKGKTSLQVFNLVNPTVSVWSALAPGVCNYLETKTRSEQDTITMVPYREWFDGLQRLSHGLSAPDSKMTLEEWITLAADCPALKMLAFFQGLNELDAASPNPAAAMRFITNAAVDVSPSLRSLEAVHPQWMERWMRRWQL